MPCRDGREDEDARQMKRHLDALTALLCATRRAGKIEFNAAAENLADAWCRAHAEVDRLREQDKQDRTKATFHAYLRAMDQANMLLDQAYAHLCKP